ncbi:MAG: hypothetical protein GY795_47825 [Desulfobacterales bacterium]|nr:hypothetical protein [Desulfobacterales bacterium]
MNPKIPLQSIVDDILEGSDLEVVSTLLECSNDRVKIRHALLMHFSGLKTIENISDYLGECFGRIGIHQILKSINLSSSPKDSLDSLVGMWLAHRGLSTIFPGTKPLKLAETLRETATQVSANAASYEAIEVAAPEFKDLLRLIAVYYLQGANLKNIQDIQDIICKKTVSYLTSVIERNDINLLSTVSRKLETLTFAELTGLLANLDHRPLEPYNPVSNRTVCILDEHGSQLIKKLMELWKNLKQGIAEPARDGLAYCRTLRDLLDRWEGKDSGKTGIIPRGAVVHSTTRNELGRTLQCRDELRNSVDVSGVTCQMEVGDTVILTPKIENNSLWGKN